MFNSFRRLSFTHFSISFHHCPKSTANNRRWFPNLPEFEKVNKHEALADITESLNELKYYKEHLFKL